MKRQKRDRLERAHQRGYQAGIAGRSKEMCPYQTLNQRSQMAGRLARSHGGQGSNGLILSL
ncbi:ribosome modulation factor [Escherichia coli]|nr:ribosome modulation factor [Escherichia coli]